MKQIWYIYFFMFFMMISCSQNGKNGGPGNTIRNRAMEIAIKYAKDKLKEPKETVAKDGIVTIVDNQVNFVTSSAYQVRYVIDPQKIEVGLIDDDENEDAIVPISSINGQDLEIPEHLIIIKTDGKFILSRVIETNMKILGIKNRIITAEVSTRSLNSPLRNCSVCKEVVKYKFRLGDLIKIE